MTANTMREAFEKWYLMQRVSHASHLKQDSNGCYFGAHTETAWKAWQAAQSVPVVGEPVAWACPYHAGDTVVNDTFCMLVSKHAISTFGKERGFPLIVKPTTSITTQELDALREKAAQLEHELETERMRLVACGVIALSNTADSAINARDMLPEYWSASAQDCASAVDREMDYRSRLTVTERERDELRKDAERYRWLRDGNDNKKSAACHIAVNCYGLEWDAAIDAAIDAAMQERQ